MQVATAVTVQMVSILRVEFFNTGFLVSCNLDEQAEMLSSCTVKMAEDRRWRPEEVSRSARQAETRNIWSSLD